MGKHEVELSIMTLTGLSGFWLHTGPDGKLGTYTSPVDVNFSVLENATKMRPEHFIFPMPTYFDTNKKVIIPFLSVAPDEMELYSTDAYVPMNEDGSTQLQKGWLDDFLAKNDAKFTEQFKYELKTYLHFLIPFYNLKEKM